MPETKEPTSPGIELPERREFVRTLLGIPLLIAACQNNMRDAVFNTLNAKFGPQLKASGKTPLVEPHLHSDGAHSPESIHRAGQKYNINPFKGKSVQEIKSIIHAPQGCDWDTWYKYLKVTRKAYISPQVIGELIEDVIRDTAKDGVNLLELRVSLLSTVETMLENMGIKSNSNYWKYAQRVFDQILMAMARVHHDPRAKIETDLVVSISCQEKYRRRVPDLIRLCRDNKDDIIALDLTNEKDTPPSYYAKAIESIRADIKYLTLHCMEVKGPEYGWDALKLDPDRIGHGIRSIEDPALVRKFARRRTPFEMCVISNKTTGLIKDVKQHPMRELYEAGIPLIIASDGCNDGSTLSDNYRLIQKKLGFSQEEMDNFRQNSWKYAFRNMKRR